MVAKGARKTRGNGLAHLMSSAFYAETQEGRSGKEIINYLVMHAHPKKKQYAKNIAEAMLHLQVMVARFRASDSLNRQDGVGLLKEVVTEITGCSDKEFNEYSEKCQLEAYESGIFHPAALAFLALSFVHPRQLDHFTLVQVRADLEKIALARDSNAIVVGAGLIHESRIQQFASGRAILATEQSEFEFRKEHLAPKNGPSSPCVRHDATLLSLMMTAYQKVGHWNAGMQYFENVVLYLEPTAALQRLEAKAVQKRLKRIACSFVLPPV